MTDTKNISDAAIGDTVVIKAVTQKGVVRILAEVTKTTAKQLTANGHRFWTAGSAAGREVGQASEGWRGSYLRATRSIHFPDDKETESIKVEMAVEAKRQANRDDEERLVNEERAAHRAARFEGKIDSMRNDITDIANIAADPMEKKTAERFAFLLRQHIWDLEANENEIRGLIASEKRDLDQLADYLDRDFALGSWRNSIHLADAIAARKTTIEKAKETMYLARTIYFRDAQDEA